MAASEDEAVPLAGLVTMSPEGVITAGVLMPVFGCFAVGLRFYARRWQHIGIGADDWTMLAGVLFVVGLGIILVVGAAIGALGLHSLPAPPNNTGDTILKGAADEKAEKILRTYNIVEKPAFALIKISIVLLYRRVFRGNIWIVTTTVFVIILTLMAIAFLVTSALQCWTKNWGLWYVEWAFNHHCLSAEQTTLGFSIADVISDLIIISMPIPYIWKLKMNAQRKASVFCVFLLASSSITVGIIRMTIITILTYWGKKGYRDLLGVMTTVPTMSIIEAGFAIVAACTPTFRNLLTGRLGVPEDATVQDIRNTLKHSVDKIYTISKSDKRSAPQDTELDILVTSSSQPGVNMIHEGPNAGVFSDSHSNATVVSRRETLESFSMKPSKHLKQNI